jgi:DNA-binding NtrC family response regulator
MLRIILSLFLNLLSRSYTMVELLEKDVSQIEKLTSILLSTLDESKFFIELSQFLTHEADVENVMVFKVLEDENKGQLILDQGKKVSREEQVKEYSLINQVIRSKKGYFSNLPERDPLLEGLRFKDLKAALCLPITYENSVIAAILFLSYNDKRKFSLDDITNLLGILKELKAPIGNMKMYLAAVHLNETLLKKIEVKERELKENKNGLQVADTFKISEKEMVGKSRAFQQILGLADKLAVNEVPYLVEGENGIGKETLARRIHCRGQRRDFAFAILDCNGQDEQKLESDLFGSETPAVKKGLLELIDNGTLMLNNIHLLSMNLQKKLYQYLEEGRTVRLGGQIPYRSNVRLVAVTNKTLTQEVANKNFREDLFYAISKIAITIPALRERREDIEALANYFLNKGRPIEEQKILSPGAIAALNEYSWPNNIEELQNVVERAAILAEGRIIEKEHLMDKIFQAKEEDKKNTRNGAAQTFQEMTLEELERRYICSTLEYLGGNKTKTAKTLGITVKTLYNKLHNYGMIDVKEALQ